MTQSLVGIEPVKAGCSDDVSTVFSGMMATVDPFVPPPDSAAAEIFQSAMENDGAFVVVGRDAPIAPHGHDGVAPMRQRECAPPNQSVVLQPRNTQNYTECKGAVFDRGVAAQEANTIATDQPGQIVSGSESGSNVVSKMQDVMIDAPIERTLPGECEVAGTRVPFDRGCVPLPEECEVAGTRVPFDRGCVPLPEERRTVGCEAPIAPHGHDGVAPMRRHEDAPPNQSAVLQPRNAQNYTEYKNVLPSQNIVKPHEMPSDGNEPVLVIAPAPLPIELPAATVRQEPAAAVATHDVVKMFVAAAEAVADAILVSSGFENGEGRILVRLQPEVLGGSEVQITAKGGTLTVIVNPASQDVQTIVEANRTQFEQHLAEKVHSWRVAVAVRKGDKIDERV